jgi:protein O-mannosyl-transferase
VNQSTNARSDWRCWGPAALSAALALALYAVTLGGTYIYDDAFIIQLDERVRHPRLWGQFWTHDYFNGAIDNLYRPLVSQSYGLQWWVSGDRAWPFHLVNILLNAGVCALVAELGRRLFDWRIGLMAGLLFAAHPAHSEAVAGIVGRAELACAAGVVGAMVLFLKQPMTRARAVAIFALSLVAVLSKEQGLLMPALLAVMLPARRSVPAKQPVLTMPQRRADRQAILLAFSLIVWSVGGVMVLREEILHLKFEWDRGFLNIATQPMILSPPMDRWLMPLPLVGRYLQLLVAPVKLSVDYGLAVLGPTVSLSDPYLWLGAAAIVGWIVCLGASLIRRKWAVAFCLLAAALTYGPASNVILIATIFGERLLYLPSVFLLILLAVLLAKLPAKVGGTLLVVLVLLGCFRTWTYVRRWNNRNAFYEYSLKEQPRSVKIHILVADMDYQESRLAEARQVMDDAIRLYPNYWESWKMQALIDNKAGDWHKAVHDWKRAFDLHPAESLDDELAKAMYMAARQHATTRKSEKR